MNNEKEVDQAEAEKQAVAEKLMALLEGEGYALQPVIERTQSADIARVVLVKAPSADAKKTE